MAKRQRTVHDYDLFLSYSSKDRAIIDETIGALRREGLTVFDPLVHSHEMWGANISAYLTEVIARRVRGIIVFLSRNYLQSRWCEAELNAINAVGGDAPDPPLILPVRVDDSPMPKQLDARVYLDLTSANAADLARTAKERLADHTPKEDILAALSDEALYKRFAETRSPAVVNLLFERLYPIVRAACSTYGLATEDAEDIAQNTIVSLLHRAPELAPTGNFRRLVWAMARNSAVHLDRKKRREVAHLAEPIAHQSEEWVSSDPHGALVKDEDTRAAIQRAEEALEALSEDEKKLVVLHLSDGVSYEELSRLFSVSPATARLRLHRILQKLRTRFEVRAENG